MTATVELAQGRKEGWHEMLIEIILEQLESKFGSLSEDVVPRVNALTIRKAKALARRLLTANSLAELGL
ncbi:MAG TPA: DUF4351 domain-containing protein [Chthonomonadaceae bacterium]|nr:DUF4351 domain-containing protein [Chthonomonadaceae bacterium]